VLKGKLDDRFNHVFCIHKPEVFSPVYSLAALFDPCEAYHVKFSAYDMKTIISACVDRSEFPQLQRTMSSGSEISVHGSDEESRDDFRQNILACSESQNSNSPFSIAEKYLVCLAKTDKIDSFTFWKNISDELVNYKNIYVKNITFRNH
jgi:hypothetical protein